MAEEMQQPENLAERLRTVEHKTRRLRFGLAVLTVGLAAVLLAAAAPTISQTLRAHKFVLLDSGGNIRAELGVARGQPYLVFYDTSGVRRVALALTSDGQPGLGLLDSSGVPRVALGLAPDGRPVLELADANGKPRAGLGLKADGETGLELDDPHGQPRAVFALGNNASPRLNFYDSTGKLWMRVARLPDGTSGLSLTNPRTGAGIGLLVGPSDQKLQFVDVHGNTRAVLGLLPDGQPALALTDAGGKPGIWVGSTQLTSSSAGRTGPIPAFSITTLDRTGHVISRWPSSQR